MPFFYSSALLLTPFLINLSLVLNKVKYYFFLVKFFKDFMINKLNFFEFFSLEK